MNGSHQAPDCSNNRSSRAFLQHTWAWCGWLHIVRLSCFEMGLELVKHRTVAHRLSTWSLVQCVASFLKRYRDFPDGSVVKMPAFLLEGSRVWLLVRELRSRMPLGAAKKVKKKKSIKKEISILSSVQSLSRVWLFATPFTTAHQASLFITNSRSLLKLMSIKSVMPSTISSSVFPLTSHLQSFPASGSFPKSQFFESGGQSFGVSASVSVLPMNIQNWFPLGLIGLIFLLSRGLSRIFY